MSDTQPPIAQSPTIDWTEDGLPKSVAFDDIYFSKDDGLAETDYVFLQQNRLAQRFKALKKSHAFVIGETGFGAGLNFLATWNLWEKTAPAAARLHFISVEKYPLTRAQLCRALSLWPNLEPYRLALSAQYRCIPTAGFHRLSFAEGKVQLTLIVNDAQTALKSLFASGHLHYSRPQWQGVDAWFLDGFAPAKNPAMWSADLLATVAQLTKPGGTLATFTAASSVRKHLQNVGFTVEKIRGFGKKRQMIKAALNNYNTTINENAINEIPDIPLTTNHHSGKPTIPWAVIKGYRATEKSRPVVVLGAGLAGCHTARALADCGYQVTLIDRAERVASGASGNAQGVVYAKLSPQQQLLSEFNRLSLLYAQNYYRQFWRQDKSYGQQCGVLQLAYDSSIAKQHRQLAAIFSCGHGAGNNDAGDDSTGGDDAGELLQYVSAQQASGIAGLPLSSSGLYFPNSGWLHPAAVCQALVSHPAITLRLKTAIKTVRRQSTGWQLSGDSSSNGNAITRHWEMNNVYTLVIANATDASQLPSFQWLPIRAIRGQVTLMPTSRFSQDLKTVVCGKGYIAPAVDSYHCIGASFNLHDSDTAVKQRDHLSNLAHVTDLLPTVKTEDINCQQLNGRVSFRCVTPDYLPLTGPAPDIDAFDRDYAQLRKNARAGSDRSGTYLPGLYLNVGHGSRGLCYTPLCAALIASIISGEPPPLPQSIIQALNPARFIIRDLIRSRR